MKISGLADQVRDIPLRDVLERYGLATKPEGMTLRAKSEHHNIVVTGSRWFDNKAGVGGGGAIDLIIHIARVNFSVACPAWFFFIAIFKGSFEELPCAIPSINRHSGHAWETSSRHGSRWATLPSRQA